MEDEKTKKQPTKKENKTMKDVELTGERQGAPRIIDKITVGCDHPTYTLDINDPTNYKLTCVECKLIIEEFNDEVLS
jgi:hypothetical protein